MGRVAVGGPGVGGATLEDGEVFFPRPGGPWDPPLGFSGAFFARSAPRPLTGDADSEGGDSASFSGVFGVFPNPALSRPLVGGGGGGGGGGMGRGLANSTTWSCCRPTGLSSAGEQPAPTSVVNGTSAGSKATRLRIVDLPQQSRCPSCPVAPAGSPAGDQTTTRSKSSASDDRVNSTPASSSATRP